jgi:hypothetical protein
MEDFEIINSKENEDGSYSVNVRINKKIDKIIQTFILKK